MEIRPSQLAEPLPGLGPPSRRRAFSIVFTEVPHPCPHPPLRADPEPGSLHLSVRRAGISSSVSGDLHRREAPDEITPACGRPQGCCPPPAHSAGGLREQRMLWVGAEGGPGGVSAISTCPPPRGSLGVPGCESLISTSVAVWFGIHILCFPETRG